MKLNWLFNVGIFIDVLALIFVISNNFLMRSPVRSSDGTVIPVGDGLTLYGKLMLWLMPLGLLLLIGGAMWLRSHGKMLVATILAWLPALPVLVAIILWGGLAMIFVLFSK